MNEVHLRVADGRRLSREAALRFERLLDGEILPRLERPGRFVGPDLPQDLEAPPAYAPVHLLWPSPPEGPRTPPALELLRRALQARGVDCSVSATPTPDLIALLDAHALPSFSYDRWLPLDLEARWLVWLEEPGQLFDLLSALHAAHQPLQRRDGGPRVLIAGPACLDGFALAQPYADRVLASVDPESIVTALLELPEPDVRDENASRPPARRFAARAEGEERAPRSFSASECAQPWLTRAFDREAFAHTRILALAASETLRASLGLPDGATLRAAIARALEDAGSLTVVLALGLPGESDADRAAIVRFARELAELAGDRRRRVRLQLALVRESTLGDVDSSAWREAIAGAPTGLRLECGDPKSLLRDRRLLSAGADDAPWLERLFFDGLWSVETELAQDPSLWTESEAAAPTPRPIVIDAIASAPTGLRQSVREPQTAASTPADRWRRWSAMLPQQFDYRLEFARHGRLRHLSHRETGELLLWACREAGIDVATAGIAQPRPKLAFGPSLAVGVEGLREFVDLGLTRKHPNLKRRLERQLPAGFSLAAVRFVPGGIGRHGLNRVVEAEYEVALPTAMHELAGARIAALRSLEQVLDIRLEASTLRFALDLRGEGKKLRPRDLIARLLDGMDADLQLLKIRRTRLWAQAQGSTQLMAPMELVDRLLSSLRARERACA